MSLKNIYSTLQDLMEKNMQSLKNKTVLITGASSGIGAACAEQFAKLGCHLILAARRNDRIQTLATELSQQYSVRALTIALDVRDKQRVIDAVNTLSSDWQNIDILINNAGLALDSVHLQNGNLENWDTMIQTNINGLLYVTHTILQGMLKRNSGHIINISSVAGHDHYPMGNIYSATKHAVRALSKSLRLDLLGTKIRVSDIAPGAVNTEFSTVRWKNKEKADKFYEEFAPLSANDVAEAIVFCATRPPHVSIAEVVIFPTDQASVNHMYRAGKETKGMLD